MSSSPNFLNIPREVRQRILCFTRPDYDLRIDCKPAFIGWKFVPHYTHCQAQKWVRTLCLVSVEVAQDMVWVQEQWIKRGEQLAREQKTKKRTRVGASWTKGSRRTEKARILKSWKKPLAKHYEGENGPVMVVFSGQRASSARAG
jgi:hypothetical protein